MFKHILLPTDGSPVSNKAVKRGIDFAARIKARVTAIHVVPEFRMIDNEAFSAITPALRKRLEEEARARAGKMLEAVVRHARSRKVRCVALSVVGDLPHERIIAAARSKKCDLIMMASHGRRGLSSLLLGSETAKVLTHSRIPVLVVR